MEKIFSHILSFDILQWWVVWQSFRCRILGNKILLQVPGLAEKPAPEPCKILGILMEPYLE